MFLDNEILSMCVSKHSLRGIRGSRVAMPDNEASRVFI